MQEVPSNWYKAPWDWYNNGGYRGDGQKLVNIRKQFPSRDYIALIEICFCAHVRSFPHLHSRRVFWVLKEEKLLLISNAAVYIFFPIVIVVLNGSIWLAVCDGLALLLSSFYLLSNALADTLLRPLLWCCSWVLLYGWLWRAQATHHARLNMEDRSGYTLCRVIP